MRQYIDMTGKTTDEATNNALRQLGMERSEVSVSILEMPRNGFLGFGSRPAKVRVYYGSDPDEEEEEEAKKPENIPPVTKNSVPSKSVSSEPVSVSARQPRSHSSDNELAAEPETLSPSSSLASSSSPTANAARKTTAKSHSRSKKSKKEFTGKSASRSGVQAPEEKDLSGKSERSDRSTDSEMKVASVPVRSVSSESKRDKPAKKKKSSRNAQTARKDKDTKDMKESGHKERSGKSQPLPRVQDTEDILDDTLHQGDHFPPQLGEELPADTDDEKAIAIRTFLSGLLEQLEVSADIRIYLPEKGRYKIILEGQNLGAIIGRRGETLDAIQQLTSYSVNRTEGRVRIHLDAEGYRAKREETLQRLAEKTAAKVLRFSHSITLEPMNAYERHVIHTALQDYAGVSTHSIGTDPNRRVVISVERGNT